MNKNVKSFKIPDKSLGVIIYALDKYIDKLQNELMMAQQIKKVFNT